MKIRLLPGKEHLRDPEECGVGSYLCQNTLVELVGIPADPEERVEGGVQGQADFILVVSWSQLGGGLCAEKLMSTNILRLGGPLSFHIQPTYIF